MRLATLLHILLIVVPTLTGCTQAMFWKNGPVEERSGSEAVQAARQPVYENISVGEIKSGTPPLDTSCKTPREVAGQGAELSSAGDGSVMKRGDASSRKGTEPAPEAPHQRPSGFAKADGRPPEELKPGGQSRFAYKGETITEDTSWSGRVRIQGALTIASQATVSISPGTVVEFQRAAGQDSKAVLLIQGRIVARGTNDQPVRFTSNADDVRSGAWQGIVFLASEKKNIMEYCRIEGAETGVDAGYSTITIKNSSFSRCRTALRAQDCLVHISGNTVSNCELGISLYDSEAEIVRGDLSSNRKGISVQRTSLYLAGTKISNSDLEALSAEDSRVKIEENTFTKNGSGLALSSCEGQVSGNRIVKNREYGISITASRIRVTANDISQNGRIGIRVGDGKGIAWGNSISANGQYDLYNAGSENFKAIGNWWGEGRAPNSAGNIYDKSINPGSGKVSYFPVLQSRPVISP